jgi:hypothetical protein
MKNIYNGHDLNGGKRQGFRTQLLFKPSETFNLRWIGEYNEEDSDNGVLSLYSTGPTINGVNRYESLARQAGATLYRARTARSISTPTRWSRCSRAAPRWRPTGPCPTTSP